MEKLFDLENFQQTFDISTIGDILNSSFGNVFFIMLLIVIAGDTITGYYKAYCTKSFDSSVGIRGLIRNTVVIVINLLVSLCGNIVVIPICVVLCDLWIIAFIFQYIASITENLGVCGFTYPQMFSKRVKEELKHLKDESE